MNNSELKRAWLLHSRSFKERSVIADFLVDGYGKISIIVHNVRQSKKALSSIIQPFRCLLLSWSGKTELKKIKTVELLKSVLLTGNSLYCGFYVNELLMRSLMNGQPSLKMYSLYELTINNLKNKQLIEPSLRYFELELLSILGFLIDLEKDISSDVINPNFFYQFRQQQGLRKINDNSSYDCFKGEVLLALAARDFSNIIWWPIFKRFTRLALEHLIGNKTMHSRLLFMK